ncbi:MAG: hypothetical protein ACYCXW_22895 [Solirubrobacteraceae bacterium]
MSLSSEKPYIVHVGRVAARVPLLAPTLGWLHDAVERSREGNGSW